MRTPEQKRILRKLEEEWRGRLTEQEERLDKKIEELEGKGLEDESVIQGGKPASRQGRMRKGGQRLEES
jgi:hypothetical protein